MQNKNIVVTFGELMMRLATKERSKFIQAETFDITYAGAEANVAVDLANLGLKSRFVSKLPDNELGQAALNYLRKFGVDTNYVSIGGKRIGTYFCEMGYGLRGNKVIYDRSDSSFATSDKNDYEWQNIFQDAKWFHISGVTAAILPLDVILFAINSAKEYGLKISIDYNFRSKLWSRQKMAETMVKIVPRVDILFCGKNDALDLLQTNDEKYGIKNLFDKFDIQMVATTERNSISASKNKFSARIYTRTKMYSSSIYSTEVLDRLGGGDAFAAGLIYALLNEFEYLKAVEFASAASVLKLTNYGDFLLSNADDVLSVMNGKKSEKLDR